MNLLISYFTDGRTSPDSPLVYWGMIGAGALFVGLLFVSLAVFWKSRKEPGQIINPELSSLISLGQTSSLALLVLFFLRWQSLPPFQYRLWVYIVLLAVVVRLVILYRRYRRAIPVRKSQKTLADRYHRYLPAPRRIK